MVTHAKSEPLRQFGIVAADPLRLLGFQSLFPPDSGVVLVPLLHPTAEVLAHLSLVVIDASCTDLVFDMIEALRKTSPDVRVVVVGLNTDPDYVERVIGAGARGYLTHAATEAEIRMAVDIVLDGSVWAPRKILAQLLEKSRTDHQQQAKPPTALTPRETDVLRLLVQGASNKEIGAELNIDAAAVKAHVGRLMRKVGVSNRTALSVEVTRQGLLADLPPAV